MDKEWKFQKLLRVSGIETLEDAALNSKFVDQARGFLEAAQNKEAHLGKLNELDEDLVNLFNELHTVDDEVDEEKVTAIKENQESRRSIAELKAELTGLRKEQEAAAEEKLAKEAELQDLLEKREAAEQDRLNKQAELEATRLELEETKKKVPPPPPIEPEPEPEPELVIEPEPESVIEPDPEIVEAEKVKTKLIETLEYAVESKKTIAQADLLTLGMPPEKFSGGTFSFKFEGYKLERWIFGTKWTVRH